MAYRQSYKVTAPVARSTAYDFNAQLSKSHQRAKYPSGYCETAVDCTDEEDRDVMPHEILFEPRNKLEVSNARIHGSSSVNGVKLGTACCRAVRAQLEKDGCLPTAAACFTEPMRRTKSDESAQALLTFLKDNHIARTRASDVLTSFFTYIGVAVTPCKSGPAGGALQRQGFSASRGGLMTVVNTGKDALRAGDRVRMVIDVLDVVQGRRGHEDSITGIPHTKIVARLVHVPARDTPFEDVTDGITSRQMTLHMNEPGALTPSLERVGRQRYPWSQESDAYDPAEAANWENDQDALAALGGRTTAAERAARAVTIAGQAPEDQAFGPGVCLAVLVLARV